MPSLWIPSTYNKQHGQLSISNDTVNWMPLDALDSASAVTICARTSFALLTQSGRCDHHSPTVLVGELEQLFGFKTSSDRVFFRRMMDSIFVRLVAEYLTVQTLRSAPGASTSSIFSSRGIKRERNSGDITTPTKDLPQGDLPEAGRARKRVHLSEHKRPLRSAPSLNVNARVEGDASPSAPLQPPTPPIYVFSLRCQPKDFSFKVPRDSKAIISRLAQSLRGGWDGKRRIPPKTLLGLPTEIKRHIFSYLADDLRVSTTMEEDDGLIRGYITTATTNTGWHEILSARTVSKEFRTLIAEGIGWACHQQHISVTVDARDLALREELLPFPNDWMSIKPASQNDLQRNVSGAILGNFGSFKFIMPMGVSRLGAQSGGSAIRCFYLTFHLDRAASSTLNMSTTWTTIKNADNFPSTLILAEVFDEFEANVIETVRQLAFPSDTSLVVSVLNLMGCTVMHGVSNGPLHSVMPTDSAIEACAEGKLHELEKSRDGSRPSRELRLGWAGKSSASPGLTSHGDSFLTKWKPCGELIRNRRVEEAKLLKLGWHGSPAVAAARQMWQEIDGEKLALTAAWLAGLSSCGGDKLTFDDCHTSEDPVEDIFEILMVVQWLRCLGTSDVVKLGWRGSRTLANQRRRLREDDGEDAVELTEWLAELDVGDEADVGGELGWVKLGWHGSRSFASPNLAKHAKCEIDGIQLSTLVAWLIDLHVPDGSTTSEAIQEIFDPIMSTLTNLRGAGMIGLIVVGNHIASQNLGKDYASFVGKSWDHLAANYWPQSDLINGQPPVSGHDLRQVYEYIVMDDRNKSYSYRNSEVAVGFLERRARRREYERWEDTEEELAAYLAHEDASETELADESDEPRQSAGSTLTECQPQQQLLGVEGLLEWLAGL